MKRLYWRVYVHFLGVLFVVGLATGAVFVLGARGGIAREVAERVVRHAASLASEGFGDPAALGRRVRQLHDDFGLNVTVRDLSGRTIATAGSELPRLDAAEAAAVAAGKIVVRPRPRWIAAAPIKAGGTGALIGVLEASPRRRLGGPPAWRPFMAAGLVLVVVAVAVAPLARRISRPVERLTAAARRLGDGDLSARVPVDEPGHRRWRWHRARSQAGELQDLARAFNDMAERVERLVRAQQELLANVSHELRSPLARIRMALELLPREADADRRLRDVERDLSELDRLIDNVLTTARLDATGLPAHLGTVDARRLLGEMAERARHDPAVAGKVVEVSTGSPVSVIADEALLRRALWNLIENAAKYGAPPITLSAKMAGDQVWLVVTDQGPGVAPEDRDRVFDAFARLDRARTPGTPEAPAGGVGLGLTLARRIAEAHGGTVTLEAASTVEGRERGCRVTIRIRAAPRAR
jgi:signal transduction histidine kinase